MWFFPNYINYNVNFVEPVKVKRDPDGCSCIKCKEFCHMAEPNQEDGSFKCFVCRDNPYR